jgi:hypothetical protein
VTTVRRIRIEPEVAGGLGDGIDFDSTRRPPLRGPLHYAFSGWLGDELLETAGFWIVTEALAASVAASGLTGFVLDDVVVSLEDDFLSSGHDPLQVRWRRLIPSGSDDEDLTLEGTATLIVSERALDVLRHHRLQHAEISDADRAAPLSEAMRTYLARRGLGPNLPTATGQTTEGEAMAIAGEITTFFDALGHEPDDEQVTTALALVGPMEIGEPYRQDGATYRLDKCADDGTSFTWKDGRLLKVIVAMRTERAARPYPRPELLVDGIGPETTREQAAEVLGAPDRARSTGDTWNVGSRFLTISFAGDRVQRIGAMISPR